MGNQLARSRRELLREQLPADTFGNPDPVGVSLNSARGYQPPIELTAERLRATPGSNRRRIGWSVTRAMMS
jgi:hypothetical protein